MLGSIEPTEAGLVIPSAFIPMLFREPDKNGHEMPIAEDEAAFLVSAAGGNPDGLDGNAQAAAAFCR